jgi:alpha-L-fucosidase
MTRPLPLWFDDSKIGVFIHWGLYSVPSFNIANISKAILDGYAAEWYWYYLDNRPNECLPTPEVIAFQNRSFGESSTYSDFADKFKTELFQPDDWAQLFADAGVKYVVLTAKHHEGWCNWCSAQAWNWNSCDRGPHRDLVGELTASVRAKGLHMGLYHSIFEWYHPLYLQDKAANFTTSRYVDEVYLPQAKDLNLKYKPDLIWSDGDWEANSSYWKSPELLAWMYNEAPNKQQVIVNDRWGNDNPTIGECDTSVAVYTNTLLLYFCWPSMRVCTEYMYHACMQARGSTAVVISPAVIVNRRAAHCCATSGSRHLR